MLQHIMSRETSKVVLSLTLALTNILPKLDGKSILDEELTLMN